MVVIGLVTMAQRDLKQMVGYSSVMHMGYAFLGIAAGTALGASGVVMLMVAHGLSVALLFLLSTSVYHRTHTFDMDQMGGLVQQAPVLAWLFVAATFASIGLPGFANFWGELTIFVSLWNFSHWITIVALTGTVVSAVYGLRAAARVFFGPPSEAFLRVSAAHPPADLGWGEKLPAMILVGALLFVGFWPRSFSDGINQALSMPTRRGGGQPLGSSAPPMDFTELKEIAAGNTWSAIWPGIVPGMPRALPARPRDRAAARAAPPNPGVLDPGPAGHPGAALRELRPELPEHLRRPPDAVSRGGADEGLLPVSSILVSILARASLPRQGVPRVEFHHIVLVVTAAMMLLVQSRNFVMLFVALETVTIGLYILVSYFRSNPEDARGRPQVPHHGRTQLGAPPLRHRAPLRGRRAPGPRREHVRGDAVWRASRASSPQTRTISWRPRASSS